MSLGDYIGCFQLLVMFVGFYFGIRTWYRIKGAKRKVLKEGGEIVIALKVNHPVEIPIEKQFKGLQIETIDSLEIIHQANLETETHYELIVKKIREVMASNAQKHIHLCLSGPLGLSFLIGQLTGIHLFSVEVYQFDSSSQQYKKLPMVTRDWLLL